MNQIGEMYRLYDTQTRQNGDNTFYTRQFAIRQPKFDEYTREEKKPNFILFEVKGEKNCQGLESFPIGTKMNVTFVFEGMEYEKKDKSTGQKTGEMAIFSKVVAIKFERFAGSSAQSGYAVPAAPSAPSAPSAPTTPHTKPSWAEKPAENPGEEDDLPFD